MVPITLAQGYGRRPLCFMNDTLFRLSHPSSSRLSIGRW